MNIEYKEISGINDLLLEKILDIYGYREYIIVRDDTLVLAGVDGDVPVGFVCVTPRALEYPLEHIEDAFIEVLHVHEDYRRQGIAQHLIEYAEDWARKAGFNQIRTHSDYMSPEAIKLWHKLNYGLCPADDWIEDKQIYFPGYWAAKVLSTK